jgi:hypothetical protein
MRLRIRFLPPALVAGVSRPISAAAYFDLKQDGARITGHIRVTSSIPPSKKAPAAPMASPSPAL